MSPGVAPSDLGLSFLDVMVDGGRFVGGHFAVRVLAGGVIGVTAVVMVVLKRAEARAGRD